MQLKRAFVALQDRFVSSLAVACCPTMDLVAVITLDRHLLVHHMREDVMLVADTVDHVHTIVNRIGITGKQMITEWKNATRIFELKMGLIGSLYEKYACEDPPQVDMLSAVVSGITAPALAQYFAQDIQEMSIHRSTGTVEEEDEDDSDVDEDEEEAVDWSSLKHFGLTRDGHDNRGTTILMGFRMQSGELVLVRATRVVSHSTSGLTWDAAVVNFSQGSIGKPVILRGFDFYGDAPSDKGEQLALILQRTLDDQAHQGKQSDLLDAA
ncbi:hypothetical protein BBO99_00001191 [Phytophthora kernoviae]|uniref:Anaphase-promoting complex subunit 4 long domain-containing protein n=2 Tax=Phytophthora kernoviae TaxID=325452 RepID=A0A3R7G4F2_9STRA|nr:hypothetical protein G195_002981 [Phytophthora kernoviae 00238/432]KAG2526274.1 hypothetical protein JM16_002089 [Phytophthora kernoviae]KAG2527808.1 hypothetical protein JM18_002194 [Phytophthora kernoviae]RLN32248.1 hypothetical protein BBI17_004335 [Phytophthora kernoviae]RLN84576.1 hypothetical protein BBO99_00001191 [Phytophthora kernoviae]